MAIVENKGYPGTPKDGSLTQYVRTSATNPNTTTVPRFAGEIVLDLTSNKLWQAQSISIVSWVPYGRTDGTG